MTALTTGRLLLLSLAPLLLLAAALTGWLDLPGRSSAQENTHVEGATVNCPDGRSFTSSFEIEGARFRVLGTLISMEGRSAVIGGPTGDVPVNLSDSAEVSSGLVIGEPVKAEGSIDDLGVYVADEVVAICSVAATPTPVPTPTPGPMTPGPSPEAIPAETPEPAVDERICNRSPGRAGDMRFEVDHDEVKIKRGAVLAFVDGSLTVDTPGGPITVMITSDTEVKGDLTLATEVRLESAFDDAGNILAEEIRALCPDEAHHADDDDDAMDDDDGENEHRRMPARATPAVPAVPGEDGDPATPAIPAVPPSHDDDDDDDVEEDGGNRGSGNNGHGHDDDDDDDDDSRGNHDDDDDHD
jgi:hypothetical protein